MCSSGDAINQHAWSGFCRLLPSSQPGQVNDVETGWTAWWGRDPRTSHHGLAKIHLDCSAEQPMHLTLVCNWSPGHQLVISTQETAYHFLQKVMSHNRSWPWLKAMGVKIDRSVLDCESWIRLISRQERIFGLLFRNLIMPRNFDTQPSWTIWIKILEIINILSILNLGSVCITAIFGTRGTCL